MDSMIVPSQSNNNSNNNNSRMKSKMRNGCGRHSKTRHSFNRNHSFNHKNNRCVNRSNSLRSINHNNKNINNVNNSNRINNINNNHRGSNSTSQDNCCFGDFTREVYNAISLRLGHTLHIPEDSVQALFNDMQLYPSEAEVSAMIKCARQCGKRNGAHITVGEFCFFVRMMQNQNTKLRNRNNQHNLANIQCTSNCEVFLGGSCNPTTWRADTAIPELQKNGITFYNPQVSMWAPELVAKEHDAKEAASVLLFVVDSQTRSTAAMIEVAYLVASGRCVVVVAYPYRSGQTIMGEAITDREYKDLVEGQTNLLALVKSKGVNVHTSLPAALQCTANILRNSSNNGMTAEEQVEYRHRKLREAYDSHGGPSISLTSFIEVYEKLTNQSLKVDDLYKFARDKNSSLSFEQFCALLAELSTDNCTMFTNDGRFSDPLYWNCAFLKTQHLLKSYVLRPITNALVKASQSFQRQSSTNNNSHIDIHNPCVFNGSQIINNTNTKYNSPSHNNKKYDVYLAGSRKSHVKWRDVAIHLLKKHGVTYYNPAMREDLDNMNECVIDSDIIYGNKDDNSSSTTVRSFLDMKQEMDKSNVLLFVITNDTRSLTTMIMAAHYIGLRKNVVLCIQQLPTEDCRICNETLSMQAIKDYNRGRVYLADLAKHNNIPLFENITEALSFVINKCQNENR